MLSFDLSNVLPKRTFVYLVALIPGSFLELSILLASPVDLTGRLTSLRTVYALTRYDLIGVGVFFAFTIGSAFMFLVSPIIQASLTFFYRTKRKAWQGFCRWMAVPKWRWPLTIKRSGHNWLPGKVFQCILDNAYPYVSQDLLDAHSAWRAIIKTRSATSPSMMRGSTMKCSGGNPRDRSHSRSTRSISGSVRPCANGIAETVTPRL